LSLIFVNLILVTSLDSISFSISIVLIRNVLLSAFIFVFIFILVIIHLLEVGVALLVSQDSSVVSVKVSLFEVVIGDCVGNSLLLFFGVLVVSVSAKAALQVRHCFESLEVFHGVCLSTFTLRLHLHETCGFDVLDYVIGATV